MAEHILEWMVRPLLEHMAEIRLDLGSDRPVAMEVHQLKRDVKQLCKVK